MMQCNVFKVGRDGLFQMIRAISHSTFFYSITININLLNELRGTVAITSIVIFHEKCKMFIFKYLVCRKSWIIYLDRGEKVRNKFMRKTGTYLEGRHV